MFVARCLTLTALITGRGSLPWSERAEPDGQIGDRTFEVERRHEGLPCAAHTPSRDLDGLAQRTGTRAVGRRVPVGITDRPCDDRMSLTVRPGGYEAFLEDHQKSKVVPERLGAKSVRLMGTISGPDGPAVVASFEFDDHAGYGRFMDTMAADPEMPAMLPSAGTDDGPGASCRSSVWTVIDG